MLYIWRLKNLNQMSVQAVVLELQPAQTTAIPSVFFLFFYSIPLLFPIEHIQLFLSSTANIKNVTILD